MLQQLEDEPSLSTRQVAHNMGVNHVSVRQVLHEQLLHPYHLQKVQVLGPNDFAPSVDFCRWSLHACIEEPDFPNYVLFTDECICTREGIFNSRNSHIWAEENPHATFNRSYQERFSVNMWAGIVGRRLIGPYMLPRRLTGNIYINFLRNALPELLEDVPLNFRQNMWFQHDAAPPHFTLGAREFLNETFDRRVIGRGCPVPWPARSPDLTPLDFYLWGHMKRLVYETPVQSEEDLVARIVVASDIIQNTPGIFDRIIFNMLRRYNTCLECHGQSFEHLL